MSGICSRHQGHDPDCRMCNTDIRDVLPDYDQKVYEAKLAGEVQCGSCGFRFYRTTDTCPCCCKWTWLDGGYEIYWPFHEGEHKGDRTWIGRFERLEKRP